MIVAPVIKKCDNFDFKLKHYCFSGFYILAALFVDDLSRKLCFVRRYTGENLIMYNSLISK